MKAYDQIYSKSINTKEEFWAEQALKLNWFKSPQTILTKDDDGLFRWFSDGEINTSFLCLDQHVKEGRGERTALIYESPVTGISRKYSYNELLDWTARFAGGLAQRGISKGDRVIIYMPMIPEAVVAMLACARLGAVHSVVFGGFAAHELAIRLEDATPKAIITANYGIEIDKVIAYHPLVQKALEESSHQPELLITVSRKGHQVVGLKDSIEFEEVVREANPIEAVAVNALDPLYILYTSGTTGKPKGIVRDNGGHAVALRFSMEYIYGLQPDEVFWAASDVGWVVGHSYIVYGPLLYGATTVLYEGKPIRTPDASAFWRVIQKHKVSILFTAPTAIRAIRKEDPEGFFLKEVPVTSLRYLFLAGERCDAATLQWAQEKLKRPVIDHWWQTESGWPMIANMMGVQPFEVKPGSATKAVCGFDIQILRENGEPAETNEEAFVAIKLPLPPGCLPNLWNNTERFKAGYLSQFPGYYFSGDGGYRDDQGYLFITGRVDDIINVAGHRLSTAEMEEVVASHDAVAECAVIGINDTLKGEIPVAMVVLKDGQNAPFSILEKEMVHLVRDKIGAVACLKNVLLVKRLPKTRSGKILRKTMRAIFNHQDYAIPGTIDDATVLQEIEQIEAEFSGMHAR